MTLEKVIAEEISNLSTLERGSQEKSAAIDDLAALYKLKIEENKFKLDYIERQESTKRDEEFKNKQLEEQVKDRYFRLGIAAAELILPLIFYAAWMKKGFKFEETGAYTSTTFRNLFNRFRPTKR
jgi:hypothetical protein